VDDCGKVGGSTPKKESIKEISWGVNEKMAQITTRRQEHVKVNSVDPGA
jgi:hypothetical protein